MKSNNGLKNIKIPSILHSRIRLQAAKSGLKIYQVVEEAIDDYLLKKELSDSQEVIELK